MRPLDGVLVVSLEQAVAVPYATRLLADLGARVIKVERRDGGDFARHYDTACGSVSSYFAWEAVDWITRHPADALGLTARKAAILLNAVDVPLNHSLAFYAREPGSLLRLLAVGPWLLLPLGLVGLAWPALRVNRRWDFLVERKEPVDLLKHDRARLG